MILDIDYLKSNCKRIYNFGLGFVQIVLNDTERVHFYLDDKSFQTNEEIHNHRYNFESTILKGKFQNNIWDIIPSSEATHILKNESCNKDIKLDNDVSISYIVKLLDEKVYEVGDSYQMSFNQFHNIDWFGNTITYLRRSDIILPYAQVLTRVNEVSCCPFAGIKEEKEIWEIVEYIINN